MKNLKRIMSVIFSFVFIMTLIQGPIFTKAVEKRNEKVYVKVRFNKEDADYDGWNKGW